MRMHPDSPRPRLQRVWIRILVALGLYLFGSGIVTGALVAVTYYPRFAPQGDVSTWKGLDLDPKIMETLMQEPLAQWELLLGSALTAWLVAWGMRRWADRRPFHTLGWPHPSALGRGLAWGSVFGALLAGVCVLLIAALGQRHLHFEGFGGAPGWALAFVGVVAALSLAEEMFFRGYVFANLLEERGRVPAVLWSSMFFAGLHMGNPSAGFLGMVNVFLLGGILGILRDMTGAVAAGAGLHLAWNLMLGLVLGADVSGFTLPALFRLHLEDLSPLLGGGGFGPEGSVVVTVVLVVAAGWLVLRYLKYLNISLGGNDDAE